MDPIHPIIPNESRFPILPVLGPGAVRREQRRDTYQQSRPAPQPELEDDEELAEDPDDDEQGWDGTQRRASDIAGAHGQPRHDRRMEPNAADHDQTADGGFASGRNGGDDNGEPPRPHIDISV